MCVQNICFKFRMFSLNKKSCRMRKKGDLSNFEILTPNHLAPTAMPFRNWLSKGIFPKNHQLDLYRECSNKESEQQFFGWKCLVHVRGQWPDCFKLTRRQQWASLHAQHRRPHHRLRITVHVGSPKFDNKWLEKCFYPNDSCFLLQNSDGSDNIWRKQHESMDQSCLALMVQADSHISLAHCRSLSPSSQRHRA